MMYVGNVVGYLGISSIGDLVGRKLLMVTNLFIALLGMGVTLFCVSLTMAAVGLFLITLGVQNAFNICFFFISETMTESTREKLEVIIQLFYGLGVLINVLWFFVIGDWQLIYAICYLLPLIGVIISFMLLVKDTPMCLVMRNHSSRALKKFQYIAKMNNKKCEMDIEELASIKASYELKLKGEASDKKQKTFTILDLFRYKSLRMMTIMLIVVQCTTIFAFYAPALMLDQFNLSLYINGLVVGVS